MTRTDFPRKAATALAVIALAVQTAWAQPAPNGPPPDLPATQADARTPEVIAIPVPLPLPGQLKPAPRRLPPHAASRSRPTPPQLRVGAANEAARIEPRRDGYFNAVQVFPYSPGALYQIYVAPGQVTDIALEPGEQLTGSGPVAAGDTVRWIIGDTESGNGDTRRVHILVKPTRPAIETNLVVNTDRRTYLIELRAHERLYMPSVAWFYPGSRGKSVRAAPSAPVLPEVAQRRYRYAIDGDGPPWRPVNAYDDGRKVYIEFSPGIVQGEMPPLFIVGPDGKPEIVNYRTYGNVLIVDRLFAAAELRLGGENQQKVRIVRADGRPQR